jgi:butyryl-CoA dehydrogenase
MILSESHQLIRETIRTFARERVLPLAAKIDAEHYFPADIIAELGALGFMGVPVSETYGGSDLDTLTYAIVVDELSQACASTGVIVSAHTSLCLWPLEHFGTDEQKQQYLPKLAQGTSIGCFALSEPGTGSDAARLTCFSKRNPDGTWTIQGTKNWITNAPVADVCILLTMEFPEKKHKGVTAFIVDLKNTPGVTIGKPENKLGICGSQTSSIHFDQVTLNDKDVLGKSGEGFTIAMKTLDGGRIGIASQAVGIASIALEESIRYSQERETFGVPIYQHQTIQNYLADMSVSVDASRLLTWNAAILKDAGLPFGKQAAQAKLFASETSVAVALKNIQIHGGYGYVKDYPAERHLRDAKITEIYEGTSEIQRLVIAASLIKENTK